MKRARNLMLAAVAALALMAGVGAATASATEIYAGSYPAEIFGESVKTEISTSANGAFSCNFNRVTGTAKETLPALALSVEHGGCISAPFGEISVKSNGCKFEFKPGVETSAGVSQGTMAIGPVGCGPMTLTRTGCTTSIPAQSNKLYVSYETLGTGSSRHLSVHASVPGLEYSQSGTCANKTFNDGGYSATWDIIARNASGVWVGLYVASQPHKPQLESPVYPTTISGEQGVGAAQHAITVDSGTITCESFGASGGISGAATSLALTTSYSGCNNPLVGPETVKMNSCSFAFEIDNAGPPYTGTVDLTCSKGGDAIEIIGMEGLPFPCVVKFGPQENFGTVTYTNGYGVGGYSVSAAFKGTKMSYTQTGIFCPGGQGARTNGTFKGTTIITGSSSALAVTGEKM